MTAGASTHSKGNNHLRSFRVTTSGFPGTPAPPPRPAVSFVVSALAGVALPTPGAVPARTACASCWLGVTVREGCAGVEDTDSDDAVLVKKSAEA